MDEEKKLVTTPGIYTKITPTEYHADPVIVPSLSAGTAIKLVHETAFKAWLDHPRLGEELKAEAEAEDIEEKKASKVSRIGSAAHELLLDRGAGVYVLKAVYPEKHKLEGLPVVDLKTDAAGAEMRAAEKAGYIGILKHEYDKALELVDLISTQTQAIPGMGEVFKKGEGLGEVVCIAQEPDDGPWLRCLIDWWGNDGNITDLKTTGQDLSDEALQRKIDNENLDMRAAFYLRVVARVRPYLAGRIKYRFVFVQQKAPYDLRVVELDAATLNAGHKKVAYAIARWRWCLEKNHWPSYPKRIEFMSMPRWSAGRWEEREEYDAPVRQAIIHDPYVSGITTPHEEKALELTP